MRKTIILMLSIAVLTLNLGCSSNEKRVALDAAPVNSQNKSFIRGGVKLSSQDKKREITVVDYSFNAMIVAVSIENNDKQSLVFSDKNIKVQHVSSNKTYQTKVFSYDELLNQSAGSGHSAIKTVGSTAVSIGSQFVPFGGQIVTLGKLLFSLSQQGVAHEDRIDAVVSSQLDKMYLRQHTVEANAKYGGIIKINFTEELKTGDKIVFNVSTSNKTESFTFICQ